MTLKIPDEFKDIYEMRKEQIHLKNYIGGKWDFIGEEIRAVKNPYDGSEVAHVPYLSKDDVEKAVSSAYESRHKIRDVPAIERIELFRKAAELTRKYSDELVRSLILEAGKPMHNAKGEVNATIRRMEMVAEEARKIFGEYIPGDWSEDTMQKFALAIREPIGVVLAISPFNYPLFITSAKVIPALLAGNSVVVKLPSADPVTFLIFARILEEAGLPKGALNVVTTSGKIIDEFVDDDRIGAVTFTGSTDIGKKIANIAGMKHLHLELGGNGAAVVLKDADLDLAAKKVVHGSLNFSGQRCDAISRVMVEEDIADEFVKKVEDVVKDKPFGNPWEEHTVVGPLIDQDSADYVNGLVTEAVEKGAKLLTGGKMDKTLFQPTILDKVPANARIMKEETFGPVVTIHRAKDMEAAIDTAMDTKYGLDSCVFTNNIYKAWRVAKKLKDGEITINDAPAHGVGYFPFGGSGESGIGREGIGYSIDEMTNLKTIVFNLGPAGMGKKRQIFTI